MSENFLNIICFNNYCVKPIWISMSILWKRFWTRSNWSGKTYWETTWSFKILVIKLSRFNNMYGRILVMSKKQQVVAWVGMISFGIGFFFFSMWAEDFFRWPLKLNILFLVDDNAENFRVDKKIFWAFRN